MGRHFASATLLIQLAFQRGKNEQRQKESGRLRPLKNSNELSRASQQMDFGWQATLKSSATAASLDHEPRRKRSWDSTREPWQRLHTTEDFTATNQPGTFRHSCDVTVITVNDDRDAAKGGQTAIRFDAAKSGKSCPDEPRVSEISKDEDGRSSSWPKEAKKAGQS
jgi:hypothetical protein